ncbi:Tetratricopeptide-like helical domain [Phytophthora cactorum]|nr:Tetratricopeptide-like helical domain [Phytophthora cactorum]
MASPMLPGYDPAKMMEYLGKLPAEERKKLLEGAAARSKMTRSGHSDSHSRRPHRAIQEGGRYLCGWVAIDDAFFGIASTSLLLEDVTGQLVEIAAYGLVDPDLPPHEKQHIVASRFPRGQPVVVFEPYHKVRQDMSEGIRVEQPKELIPWKKSAERFGDVEKSRERFFRCAEHQQRRSRRMACYEQDRVLLNNMATCRFKLGEFDTAVQLAGAAARLDPGYAKAWFRLAAALVEEAAAHENKRGYCLIAQRVVAHACRAIPNLSAKDRRLLENAVSKENSSVPNDHSLFQSYVEWCAELGAPGLLMPIKRNSTDDADDLSADADTWRKAGSDCFIKGDYCAAEECYQKGLKTLNLSSRDVSLVLNNIAAVHLTLHHETSSVPGISVAEISTTSAKADDRVPSTELALINVLAKDWYTQAKCIADLNSIRASVVSKALSSAESRARVQEFKDGMGTDVELRSMQASTPQTVQRVSTVSTDVQRKERDALQPDNIASATLHEETKGGNVTCDEDKESIDQYIARMETFENMMRFGFTTSKANSSKQYEDLPREMVMFVEHPPPKIHVEFPKLRGWPEGMRDGTFKRNLYPGDMVKRWHGTAALQILQSKGASLRYGDIIDARVKALPEYDARIRSNFANNPNRAEVYFFGTTHVAIGFNDFSSLVCASLHDKADSAGPLRFCGFEMSEFAVAKCKVVAHMLGSPSISIYSVMEVWLSSTWSETTLSDFRKSVKAVLESLNGQKENAKVISYLKYWTMTETISAAKARSEFFLNMERYNKKALHAVCCFRREIDRLDLTEYLLTGEIRASSFGDVECASWRSPLEEDIAFNTVEFMDILEEYAERQKKQKDAIHRLSVTDLFVMYISRNLLRLRDLMVANKLTIEVTYGVVKAVRGAAANDAENRKLLSQIAALRPYTISWSNVLDYFLPDDFHDLARRCSVHGDCMYYGYSMNWTTKSSAPQLLTMILTNPSSLSILRLIRRSFSK